MALDSEKRPRDILVLALAVGLKIWGNKPWSAKDYFDEAETFVKEAENRFGKINP